MEDKCTSRGTISPRVLRVLNLLTKTYKSIRHLGLPLAFILIFGALGTYLLVGTHAETALEPSVSWGSKNGNELVNLNSGLCLSTPGTTESANGTKLVLETCAGLSDQKWALTWGGGTVTNTTVTNGFTQCLDDTLGSATAGNPVQVWTCNGEAASQTWTSGYGEGSIRIHGLCLGVNGNAKTVGSAVVIMGCNVAPPPNPVVSITAPGSGTTVSGGSVTVSAQVSVSSGSVASITLAADGGTLKTCTNTTTCSATWGTTSLQNGAHAIEVSATASGGGSTQTSEPVTVSNATASSGSGSSSSGSSGGTTAPAKSSSGTVSNTSGSTGDSSSSDDSGATDTTTGTDTTGSTSTTTTDGSGTVTYGSTTSSKSGHRVTTKKAARKSSLGAILTILALLVITVVLVILLRKRKQVADAALAVRAVPVPIPTPVTNSPAFPREDDAATAARLNWWMPDSTPQQGVPSTTPSVSEPPDMFEEGRKRLDDEEKERQKYFPQ
jgi:hypothetical protein